ncbi:MAG TPA: cache domain-containing protein [Geobacteraceae bacterium]|nr:cache domain-containing protein [Geobacteraceae bacterium]
MPGFGLKTKITIVVSALVVVIISVTAFFYLWYFEHHFKETISQQQFTLVSVIADDCDYKIIDSHNLIIEAAKKIDPAIFGDARRARKFLEKEKVLLKTFDYGIFMFDGTGTMVAEAPMNAGRAGRDFSFREYYRGTVALRRPYISKPYLSPQNHQHPAVMFTAPVFDNQHQMIGILAGSLDLIRGGFLANIRNTKIGKNGYLYLYAADRTMIMHPDQTRIMKKDVLPGANKLSDQAIEGFEGSGEIANSRGLRSLSSYKRLKSTDWIVGADFPIAEAYAPFHQVKKYILAGLVTIVLVTVLILAALMKYLTAPLRLLERHVEELPHKKGEDKLLRMKTGGEIGALVSSSNRMVAELDNQKKALQESEELYRTLVDFTTDFIFWRSADRNTMLYVSPQCLQFTGYEDNEFYRHPGLLDDIVYHADQDRWLRHVAVACAGACADPLELRFVARNGVVRWVNHFCRPVFSDNGTLLGVRGSFTDISDQKKVEETQHQQLHLLQTLLDAIPGPVFYKDLKGV